ncbi:MAG TPA: Fic family protein [Polyangiaceae bacterium]|jgi:Fic family protein
MATSGAMPSRPSPKKKQPAPVQEVPKVLSVEERTAYLEARLKAAPAEFQAKYRDDLDVGWIAHDSALEGVVYTLAELRTALGTSDGGVAFDSTTQPVVEEIRRHREALNLVRELAIKRRQPVTVDVVKRVYCVLHPEEGDIKTVKYRKDIPQHRLYFHEYTPPDKIAYKLRQIIDWVNDPEMRTTRTPVRLAARAHYDILRIFPFATDSGKVARLMMNLLLLRSGYPPAIIHSTERQRYYEALKGSSATMYSIVQDAIENSLASIEKLLDQYDGK